MTRFPSGFLWGTATASHQVEGNNYRNDWWECEQDGRLPHRSGEACDQYRRFRDDIQLAASMGNNAQRFSLEWSRIEPAEGSFDQAALQHYADVIAAMTASGIEPVVTLHHFSNPAWFAHRGGWSRADAPDLFRRYVEIVAAALSGSVRYWLTINEPTVYIKRVYVMGDWPPCRQQGPWKAFRALRNLCRAHVSAYDILHRHRADVMVGFAHSAPFVVASDPRSWRDRLAAWSRDLVLNRVTFWLLGRPPRSCLDFIAVNYYTRQLIKKSLWGLGLLFGVEDQVSHLGQSREFNSLGWEIYPDGLAATLHRFSRYGLPLFVTENGISTLDENLRTRFLLSHIAAVAIALRQGLDVRGYFYWTLYDNFEWREGFNAHFGLAAVNRDTQQRLPRPAAAAFAAICKSNAV